MVKLIQALKSALKSNNKAHASADSSGSAGSASSRSQSQISSDVRATSSSNGSANALFRFRKTHLHLDEETASRASSSSTTCDNEIASEGRRTPIWMTTRVEGCDPRTVSVISRRLAFSAHRSSRETHAEIKRTSSTHFFTSNVQKHVHTWGDSFGTIGLHEILQFREIINEQLKTTGKKRQLVYYCRDEAAAKANTALLFAAYLVLEFEYTAEQALRPFLKQGEEIHFWDVLGRDGGFRLTFTECVKSIEAALKYGWLDRQTHSLIHANSMCNCQSVCPELLASGVPISEENLELMGPLHADLPIQPKHFVAEFRWYDVSTVIRVAKPDLYDAAEFKDARFKHYDVPLKSSSPATPSDAQIETFLVLMTRKVKGRAAVVCAEGTGHSGVLCAAFLMARYHATAAEAAAWLCLCRPGISVGVHPLCLSHWDLRRSADPGFVTRVASEPVKPVTRASSGFGRNLKELELETVPQRRSASAGAAPDRDPPARAGPGPHNLKLESWSGNLKLPVAREGCQWPGSRNCSPVSSASGRAVLHSTSEIGSPHGSFGSYLSEIASPLSPPSILRSRSAEALGAISVTERALAAGDTERGPAGTERGPMGTERGPMGTERGPMGTERASARTERAAKLHQALPTMRRSVSWSQDSEYAMENGVMVDNGVMVI